MAMTEDVAGPAPRAPDGPALQPAPPRRRPQWSDYTAFVFSSGGARGALQVGALRALFEHGETPDVIVGTSIGSWNGAMVARNPTPSVIEELMRVWQGLTTSRVLLGWEPRFTQVAPAFTGAFVVAAMRRVTMGMPSLYGDSGLRQIFAEHFDQTRFEDMRVPFRVIASNLTSGGISVFGQGPIEMALLASAAIPGIFPPVRINGQTFVDGGALESASIDTAIALGARRIFVLDAGNDATPEADELLQRLIARDGRAGQQPNAHALAVMLERTATMMGRYQLERAIERIPPGVEAHIIGTTSAPSEATLDFDHAVAWIDAAYESARAYLRERVQPLPRTSLLVGTAALEAGKGDAGDTERRAG
ncbi:MAG TPA: patatin-like phospholipase family protein [Ktedonobacterales bacterium]|nr:patatin-like phospholipase family protein [Ktedonobacterales bacterium]